MQFNSQQNEYIDKFVKKYHEDEIFKAEIQDKYINNPEHLSILEIYALEEILDFGTNDIYRSYMEFIENSPEFAAIDQIKKFLQLIDEDESFKNNKLYQFRNMPETLSEIELYALRLIVMQDKYKEIINKHLKYDDMTPIKYGNDSEIRETLTNLLFGEIIYQILNIPELKDIKDRQKKPGMVANIDKQYIIELVQCEIAGRLDEIAKIIDNRFFVVRFNVSLGKRESSFEEYLKYNTNISAREILQIGKNNTNDNKNKVK